MADAGLEPTRRLAALRYTNEALAMLDAIHHKWLLMRETRPDAAALRQFITGLTKARDVLAQSEGDHWTVAPELGSIAETLSGTGNPDLEPAGQQAQLAYDEIMAQRETV
jgi:hypothetical protein